MVGGNITALMQVTVPGKKNSIGEKTSDWVDVIHLKGWLDYQSGDSKRSIYNAKIEESTHVFLCDSFDLNNKKKDVKITPENARMIINGQLYDILLIDDPMEMHQHLEIYLKYAGGQ